MERSESGQVRLTPAEPGRVFRRGEGLELNITGFSTGRGKITLNVGGGAFATMRVFPTTGFHPLSMNSPASGSCARFGPRFGPVALMIALVGWVAPGLTQDVTVKERGPHHQKVELVSTRLDEAGNALTETNSYVQLETGLNFRNGKGEWEESKAEFQLVPEGAIAWKGQHRVSLAGDLNTAEAMQLRLPDGKLVAGHVLGLAYYDSASGEAVIIAPVRDSGGWQVASNQIVYPGAFEGIDADVRYTFSRNGFEQDIILREQPPSPEKFGLNSATTRLEVWTEFTTAPEPQIKRGGREDLAANVTDDADETLDFGSMQIGEGRSFRLGGETESGIAVRKRWLRSTEDRKFLVEAVDLSAVAGQLDALPANPTNGKGGAALPLLRPAQRQQVLNALPAKVKRASAQTAMVPLPGRKDLVAAFQRPGLVVDFQVTITGDPLDFTFQGDTTYYISGSHDLFGTTTLEGGAVIKFDKYVAGSVDSKLYVRGPFVSRTSRHRPAVFTAKDDNSVGETIAGSTGNPGTDYYAYYALRFYNGPAARLEHARFCNAHVALSFNSGTGVSNSVFNVQFVNCTFPMGSTGPGEIGIYNMLVDAVRPGGCVFFNWTGAASPFYGQNVTIHSAPSLRTTVNGSSLTLTNSLLVQVASIQSYTGRGNPDNQEVASAVGVFQPRVMAGRFYLPAGSPYRNSGTADIDPDLAAELKQRTTTAPVELASDVGISTILSPLVPRDTDTPDLGYHYAPIDYCLSGRSVGNATLTLTNGVVVGVYGATGLTLNNGAVLVSEGLPHRLNRLVRYQNVQEQPISADVLPAATAVALDPVLRNDYSGWVGARFAVGTSPIWVNELGRWVVSGNSGQHAVRLVNADGTDVPGGSVTVNTAGALTGQFKYAPLPAPVVLLANTTYFIFTQEVQGGDLWHGPACELTAASGITFTALASVPNNSTAVTAGSTSIRSYGPVNFRFGRTTAPTGLLAVNSLQTTRPTLRFRFTDVPMMGGASGARTLLSTTAYYVDSFSLSDSFLGGARLALNENQNGGGQYVFASLTNNVAERAELVLSKHSYGSDVNLTVNLFNNLFYRGTVTLNYDQSAANNTTWTVKENQFDWVTLTQNGTGTGNIVKGYNGYLATTSLGGSGNQTLGSFTYAAGKLGSWYQGVNTLQNYGSRTAAAAGLYHHTTTTDQVKDTGTVDIGFHYVAAHATTGLPLDTDGDGLADYWEDRDGDNVLDAGETSVTAYDSAAGLANAQAFEVFTPFRQ